MKYKWFFSAIAMVGLVSGMAFAQVKPVQPITDGGLTPTNELLIKLKPGTSAFAFATATGMSYVSTQMTDEDMHVFSTKSVEEAERVLHNVREMSNVVSAYNNSLLEQQKFAFVPNDPLYFQNGPFNGFYGQWHLVNPYAPGRDARVWGAWQRNLTGSGISVVVLDDAFELGHEDFAGNSSAALSWNFQTGNNNVAPTLASDNHGTAVAGVTAARGGNGIGVTGAAPLATFGGFRVLYAGATIAIYVDAMKLFSFGSNTTAKLKNHSYGPTSNYQVQTVVNEAIADSASAGTIHVFSAGNNRGTITEDTNRFPNHSSRDVITVAALGSDGIFSDYSNFGACIFVTGPTSSNRPNAFGIVTTDRSGAPGYNGSEPLTNRNYTMFFGGTSSSAPLVTGCLTLAKQAQPALNVRFAKHLLARFSTIVDPSDATVTSDGGWRTNSAGFTFNQNYGFGNINADLVSAQALNFTGVTPRTNEVTQVINVNQQIPDNNPAGLTRNFTMAQTGPLEEVEVFVAITHPYRGDIEIFLTNPDGYTSRLVRRSNDSGANISWIFLTNAFWGTNPAGQWTLRVVDTATGDVGTWNNYQVRTNMGTLIPASKAGITWQNTSSGNGGN
ncbi:MAG: S8 family serine peptidase, partial [Fimbriimonadaceae bacterium]